ncbi:hypothetical protein GH714_029228 [Hevea brasiliensis]|uniref:VWFA domain-containing protein n=1 Tax=Hevea brasiliensis TaxID=3981 RepID=A0A6A6M4G1_HEVBR|nr:hypothetical protein GH714_029228 [Hevea brasiliensis]
MSFNDDEQIISTQDSGSKPIPITPGRVQLVSIHNNMVPLEKSKLRVMLEITGGGSTNDRPGLDLVAVLDVSGSMGGEKIAKVKTAMLFMIYKLSPIDRLSVVTFESGAKRLCPLRQITENSQKELENLINGLNASGGTNITAGLQTGLKVINDRSLSGGRSVGIMLMSDGEQNVGGDAAKVPVGNVPVHTFGFGTDQDPVVLKAIADNSIEGTFSEVQNTANLSIAFSQCLAGLLTRVVEDLKLTITRCGDESKIQQSLPKEVRKVIVDLLLSPAEQERGAGVLEISYSYRFQGKTFQAPPAILTVCRTRKSADQQERSEVKIEETRLLTANAEVRAATALAIDEITKIYEKQGVLFALSSETSHDRQRFAARGDVESLRLFATPRMDKYLKQAKSFDEDPSKPLPSVDEDEKEELAANPLAPIAGAISFYLQLAMKPLCILP